MNISSETRNRLNPILSGVATGMVSSVVFHPFDKVLYQMNRANETTKVSILTTRLWTSPFQGVSQTTYGRLIGYGLNLPLYDFYKSLFLPYTSHASICSAIVTSLNTAALTHWVSIIKIWQFNNNISGPALQHAQRMKAQYGVSIFFRGMPYTCLRDSLFAGIFFPLSEKYNPNKDFDKDMVIATLASAIGAPVNYARNEIFFNLTQKPRSLRSLLQKLGNELSEKKTLSSKVNHLLFTRFCLGFGTARVGIGMAFARTTYEYIQEQLADSS